jgi:hypothetical protein
MGIGHFVKLVDEAKELGAEIISIFGYGEPLLDPGVGKKISYCTHKGLKTFITTNASRLTPKMISALVKAKLTKIRISMHGSGKSYENVHRGLNWKQFTQNITTFMELNNGQIETELTIIPMNGESISDIIKQWDGFFDHLEIWRPHNWAYGKKFRHVNPENKTCGRPFSGPVQINADGSMMVCCFDFDAKMTVGTTHRQSIEQILKGRDFERIRTKHRIGNLEDLPCESCDQLNHYDKSPLLFSTKDETRGINKTSTNKFKLKEI